MYLYLYSFICVGENGRCLVFVHLMFKHVLFHALSTSKTGYGRFSFVAIWPMLKGRRVGWGVGDKEEMDGWMSGRVDGWVDGWMDGWVDGLMGGWIDG